MVVPEKTSRVMRRFLPIFMRGLETDDPLPGEVMATNHVRIRTPLALERLEAREVPAAYSWASQLIAEMYQTPPPPPPSVDESGTGYRLASNGLAAQQESADPPAIPAPPPIGHSDLLNLGGDTTPPASLPPVSAMPGRDFILARGGMASGQTTNHSQAPLDEIPPTGVADAAIGPDDWQVAPDYGRVRFASDPIGVAVNDALLMPLPALSPPVSRDDLTSGQPAGADVTNGPNMPALIPGRLLASSGQPVQADATPAAENNAVDVGDDPHSRLFAQS
jgi:hypothetical protein